MKKILFEDNEGRLCLVIPADKKSIERTLGTLSDAEYEAHVKERSIPKDAKKVRDIEDKYIPTTREFRGAWCDITAEPRIDIDCEKARDIKLAHIRTIRDKELLKTDGEYMKLISTDGAADSIAKVREEKQALRDITNPLKALNVSGKINDEVLLKEISDFGNVLNDRVKTIV